VTASDVDGDDLSYFWDFGDGLIKENGPEISHAFTENGAQTVKCTVTDTKGGTVTVQLGVTISSQLETWPSQQTPSTRDYYDATVGDGLVVVVGVNAALATSADGSTWSTGYVGGFAGNERLEDVIYDGSLYVTVGWDYDFGIPDWVGTVWTSPDASTWTRRLITGISETELYGVAFGNGVHVAVGKDCTVYRSTNGTSWSAVALANAGDLHAVQYTGGQFVAVGRSDGGGALVYTSADGTSWTDLSAGAPTATLGFRAMELVNGQLLASGPFTGIHRSTDGGSSFSQSDNGAYEIAGFAYGNGLYLAAGNYNSSGDDVNLVSLDGVTWTEITTAAQEDRGGAAFYNDSFITVGDSGTIWKSAAVASTGPGWGTWYVQYTPAMGLNRDAAEDADLDGALNILEYAVGTDPSDATSVPVALYSVDASGYLNITIQRTAKASDLDYTVERTTDPSNGASWTTVDTVVVTDTATELTVRTAQPMGTLSPQFLRLKVEFKPFTP
jgi:hypothetical protein